MAAPALAAAMTTPAAAQQAPAPQAPAGPGRPILIKGGCVLSLDRAVGDFEQADVLIEGGKISAVRPSIAAANAEVIDAANTIVMPGFVDTHRHMWQGILRNVLPDGSLDDYIRVVQRTFGASLHAGRCLCRRSSQRARRDRHRRDLRARLVAHPQHARAHRRGRSRGLPTPACARCSPTAARRPRPANGRTRRATSIPSDIARLRKQYFSSEDQLMTLYHGGALGRARRDPANIRGGARCRRPHHIHVGVGERGRVALLEQLNEARR